MHHAALLEVVQAELEVTVKLVLPAEELTFWLTGVTVRVGDPAAWVTVTTTGASPVTVTVILAVRPVRSMFCV